MGPTDVLCRHLNALASGVDRPARVAHDPVKWPRRYTMGSDREIAGLVASSLAFGRVAAFQETLGSVFAVLDAAGGPTRAATISNGLRGLDPLRHRWIGGAEVATLVRAAATLVGRHGSLGSVAQGSDLASALGALVDALRSAAGESAPQLDRLVSDPRRGSACKRLAMFARWMVRTDDGVDLGVWNHLRPDQLVIPLDTHVARISRFVGLLTRATTDWKAALEVTAGLATFDEMDPVRFDFALAHLGISGACRGYRHRPTCELCPLDAVCQAPLRIR